ncbi:MAG: nucleotidyltransferase domain-containing protein [Schwartzia succinivorans]|nr:nucleotidyltransferase domain-containing protein [Schwartzia succinivorans]
MNAMPNLEAICNRVAGSYRRVYGSDIQGIYLYGSYARGDYDESSDLDFVALVKGERRNLQRKLDEVWNDTVKMDLEYDIVTSPTVIPVDEFQKYRDELPYYRNIFTEGKRIG